jgi:hypothetical protein
MTDVADGDGISRYPPQAGSSPNVRGWVVGKVRRANGLNPDAPDASSPAASGSFGSRNSSV